MIDVWCRCTYDLEEFNNEAEVVFDEFEGWQVLVLVKSNVWKRTGDETRRTSNGFAATPNA